MKFSELTVKINDKIFTYDKPIVMGIVNCTPDSFHADSRKQLKDELLRLVEKHISDGATIIDLGGFSTRPNAKFVSEIDELERLKEPLSWIKEKFPDTLIAFDTFRSSVADYCLKNGAHIINDISAGSFDTELPNVIAKYDCPYIIMHLNGDLATMHNDFMYQNITEDVLKYFKQKIQFLHQKGITQLIIDLGFGFSKSMDENFELLQNLTQFKQLNAPILVGLSRKRMIWQTLNSSPNEALNGTTVLNTLALQAGVQILRVHDVKEAMEVVELVRKLKN